MYHGVGQSLPMYSFTAVPTAAPTCLTKEQHDAAVYACSALKDRTVKGLGQSTTDPCYLATLPICLAPATFPTDATTPGPGPEAPPPETEGDHKGALMWGGLLLVVLAAGGYAVYRGTRKRR
jgi:hypothetical protein